MQKYVENFFEIYFKKQKIKTKFQNHNRRVAMVHILCIIFKLFRVHDTGMKYCPNYIPTNFSLN